MSRITNHGNLTNKTDVSWNPRGVPWVCSELPGGSPQKLTNDNPTNSSGGHSNSKGSGLGIGGVQFNSFLGEFGGKMVRRYHPSGYLVTLNVDGL